MPRKDYQEQLAYNREWRARNREKIAARDRDKYAKNPAPKLASNRKYLANNLQAVTVQRHEHKTNVRISDPAARMYKDAKARARKRGLPFNIEVSDIRVPLCCPLLGVWLIAERTDKKSTPRPCTPSLDRIRPELGYVRGNVRVISHLANTMKNAATPEQLRMFAVNVLKELERA